MMINCLGHILKDRGVTRIEFAKACGLKLKTINRLVNCQISISPKAAEKIVRTLKMRSKDVFFDGCGRQK